MIQVALAILLILAIVYVIKVFNRQKRLSLKEQELEEAEMDSDVLDIDKNIAQERAHQRDIKKDINDLKQGNNK